MTVLEKYLTMPRNTVQNLLRIDLSSVPGEEMAPLIELFASCTWLREALLMNRNISDDVLFAQAKGCPHLQELSLWCSTGYSQAGLKGAYRSCTEFQEVVLWAH